MTDNFWAKKLGVETVQSTPTFQRSNDLFPLYTTPQSRQETVPSQQVATPQGQVPQAQEQAYTPTVRMKQGSTCPGCGGDKYFRPSPSLMETCADCGYNSRFEQQAYGAPTIRSEGPVGTARQVASSQTLQASIAVLNAGGGEHI